MPYNESRRCHFFHPFQKTHFASSEGLPVDLLSVPQIVTDATGRPNVI